MTFIGVGFWKVLWKRLFIKYSREFMTRMNSNWNYWRNQCYKSNHQKNYFRMAVSSSVTSINAITQYQPPPPSSAGGTTPPTFLGESQILKRGDQKKNSAWRVLKCPCHRYLPGGDLLCFLLERRWRLKCGFEGWIFKCQSWPVLAKQPINV